MLNYISILKRNLKEGNMKKKHSSPTVYCIFYLEKDYYTKINEDLKSQGYSNIRAIIPTVRILRKIVHGREVYEEVPLLFNYAFMRMSKDKACSREYMNKLKRDIPGIRNWLKSNNTLAPKKIKKRVDNIDIFDDFSLVATATKKEVRYFQRLSRKNKRFSLSDLMNISIGDYIILNGYPYEGVDATVLDINHNTKMIKLLLYPNVGKMEVTLPFDQVIYTVYSNYDPDSLRSSDNEVDMSTITEESINKVLDLRQY